MEKRTSSAGHIVMTLHPAEVQLIEYIRSLRFGRIERLEVQDGLPVVAEEVKERVRFGQREAAGRSHSDSRGP